MAQRQRLSRLRREIEALGLDALLVSNIKNITYLSGFTGSSAVALVTGREAFLVTDFRYRLQAAKELRHFKLVEQEGKTDSFLPSFLAEFRFDLLGFESSTSYDFYGRLRRASRPGKVKAVNGLVENLRMVKEKEEIIRIRETISLSIDAFNHFAAELRPGLTEREAALILEGRLRQMGSDPLPFPIIVAAGESGAMPHAVSGGRIIEEGRPIVIDFGASLNGYASDMTRTICLGKPSRDIAKIYRLVYSSQKSAIEKIGQGVAAGDVDRAAREMIEKAGMGRYFGHGTGHGVGIDVHERPSLSIGNREKLQPGMVVTVEPGIYVESLGGVRLEDMVLVTEKGGRVLTGRLYKPGEIGPYIP